MDLEARVTALEDEVGILKSEIKSVLLEVRTAFLAQSNPFTNPQLSMNNPLSTPPPQQPEPQRVVITQDSFIAEEAVPPAASAALPASEPEPQRPAEKPIARIAEPVFEDAPVVRQPVTPRFDMNTLAMLMAWAQGNMSRLNIAEMGALLSLARYGGVIEGELEQILLKIANHFENDVDPRTGLARQKPTATISEYLLALHELHTVINEEDEPAFRWLRKVG